MRSASRSALVLLLSGTFGYLLGAFVFPDWQVAVESGQVLANLVQYPRDSPFLFYHLRLWTLANQLSALLLWCGLSEIAVSHLLSGVVGMVSFQALALIVFSFCGDVLLAVGAPFLILFSRTTDFGVSYPIALMGSQHTYGVLGLSFALLVLGCISAELYRSGGFLLGLAPAVHPSLAVWLGVIIAICFAWHPDTLRQLIRRGRKWLAAGALITATSLAFQLFVARDIPAVPASVSNRYLTVFVQFWDGHRSPMHLRQDGMYLAVMCALLSVLWLYRFRKDRSGRGDFLLRALVTSTAVGTVCAFISWIPAQQIPAGILILMPNRILNLSIMAFAAMLIGLLASYRRNSWVRCLLGLVVADLCISAALTTPFVRGSHWLPHDNGRFVALLRELSPIQVMATATFTLVLVILWPRLRRLVARPPFALAALIPAVGALALGAAFVVPRGGNRRTYLLTITIASAVGFIVTRFSGIGAAFREIKFPPRRRGGFAMGAIRAVSYGTTVVFFCVAASLMIAEPRATRALYRDRTNDSLWHAVASQSGVLLTAGDFHLIQLRTRRPVLLDGGGLDMLPYALAGGPTVEKILREVYGIDFFQAPPQARGTGSIPWVGNKELWEQREVSQWKGIGASHGVTGVLTPAEWHLQLPLVAADASFALYKVGE